jgi:hypothetical protein
MSDTVCLGFAKLNNSNYIKWAIQIEAELVGIGLWSMVEVELDNMVGKDAATIAAELAVKKSKWIPQKMAQAQAEIVLHVEDGQLEHMHDWDPMVIWETLQSVHQAHGFATSLALHCCFSLLRSRRTNPCNLGFVPFVTRHS